MKSGSCYFSPVGGATGTVVLVYLFIRVTPTDDLNAILYPPSSENTVRCIAVLASSRLSVYYTGDFNKFIHLYSPFLGFPQCPAARPVSCCGFSRNCVGCASANGEKSITAAILVLHLAVKTLPAKINIWVKNGRISDILTATKSD